MEKSTTDINTIKDKKQLKTEKSNYLAKKAKRLHAYLRLQRMRSRKKNLLLAKAQRMKNIHKMKSLRVQKTLPPTDNQTHHNISLAAKDAINEAAPKASESQRNTLSGKLIEMVKSRIGLSA